MRMTGFAFRRRAEHRRDVVLAFDVGLVGEVQIPAVRLRFACERGLEILMRLAAVEVLHRAVSFRCCDRRGFPGPSSAASRGGLALLTPVRLSRRRFPYVQLIVPIL